MTALHSCRVLFRADPHENLPTLGKHIVDVWVTPRTLLERLASAPQTLWVGLAVSDSLWQKYVPRNAFPYTFHLTTGSGWLHPADWPLSQDEFRAIVQEAGEGTIVEVTIP